MAIYELPKAWRADVGGNETGTKSWGEYCVEIEYVQQHPSVNSIKYYMRWTEWFTREEDAYNFLKDFKYPIRQAWIDRVVTVKTRKKYYDSPHNIEDEK